MNTQIVRDNDDETVLTTHPTIQTFIIKTLTEYKIGEVLSFLFGWSFEVSGRVVVYFDRYRHNYRLKNLKSQYALHNYR